MTTVIAATDLTARSANVPGRAARIAATLGARVLLVHVSQPENGLRGAMRLAAKPDRLRARLARLAQGMDLASVEVRQLEGPPENAIAALAAAEDAALIVLGLHRRRRVLDVLRLTTMERIVLRARAPVLIAHLPPTQPYRKVLAALTFSPACTRALQMARRIAPDAALHGIHALQLPLRDKLAAAGLEASRAMTEAEMLRDAFLAQPGMPVLSAPPEIVAAGVHDVLRFRIEELQPELLVIGTHSGRDPDTLGNYARDLLRAPPTDVLAAKPV